MRRRRVLSRKLLWIPRVVDIGNSDPQTGRPVSLLIDYTINTAFPIADARIAQLRALPWVEEINRRRGLCAVQLIVRCLELPPTFKGANCHVNFLAALTVTLCG